MSRLPSPLAAAVALALVGCAGAAPEPPKKAPLGAMPTAVTTAQPEWIASPGGPGAPPPAAR